MQILVHEHPRVLGGNDEVTHMLGGALRRLLRHPVLMVPSLAAMGLVFLLSVATIGGSPMFGRGAEDVLVDGLAPRFIGFGSGLLVLGFLGISLSFLAHGLTVGMAAEILSTKGATSLRSALRFLRHRAVDLCLASVLLGLAVSLGFRLLFVPGLLAVFCFLFTYPIIVDEGGGAIGSARKSLALVQDHPGDAGKIFGVLLGVHFFAWLIGALGWRVPFAGKLISLFLSGCVGGYAGLVVLMAYREFFRSEPTEDHAAPSARPEGASPQPPSAA